MLKGFRRAADDVEFIEPSDWACCYLYCAAASLGSSCVLNASQVVRLNLWILAASLFKAWLSWARESSECIQSFASACHSERRNNNVLMIASSFAGNRPSKAGIEHCDIELLRQTGNGIHTCNISSKCLVTCCHAPNRFGTVDIGIISPALRKLKSFFKNIFIGLKHLELRKRKIVDVIPRAGYNKFKKDSDANDMTVQQYYRETYNIHIK